jgi:hypothetical protein
MVLKITGTQFSVVTQAFGKVDFPFLTMGKVKDIEQAKIDNGHDFVTHLISLLGKKADGAELNLDDAKLFTSEERGEFIEKYLNAHPNLTRETKSKIIDRDGRRIVTSEYGEVIYPQNENETKEDYLHRVYKESNKRFEQSVLKSLEPYKSIFDTYKSVFPNKFQDLFKQSKAASGRLGESISSIELEAPRIPIMNLKTTTDMRFLKTTTDMHFDRVVNRLNNIEELAVRMADTVKSVSDTAAEFLKDFGIASDKVNESSKGASRLALFAILISLVTFFGQIFWSDYKDKIEQKGNNQSRDLIVEKLDRLIFLEKELNKNLEQQDIENNKSLLEASKNMKDAADILSAIKSNISSAVRNAEQSEE